MYLSFAATKSMQELRSSLQQASVGFTRQVHALLRAFCDCVLVVLHACMRAHQLVHEAMGGMWAASVVSLRMASGQSMSICDIAMRSCMCMLIGLAIHTSSTRLLRASVLIR